MDRSREATIHGGVTALAGTTNVDDQQHVMDGNDGTSASARVTCGGGASAREPPVDDGVSCHGW